MTFVISAFQMYVLHFWHLFENQKDSGLTPDQNDDPYVKDDPVPCLPDALPAAHSVKALKATF